ncbi:hypothetical protein KAR91_01255 [Candidatus Pacearchaeota archaeon]|nr:hypothetical protein [Candidatus Pacearchaeota archaeon]
MLRSKNKQSFVFCVSLTLVFVLMGTALAVRLVAAESLDMKEDDIAAFHKLLSSSDDSAPMEPGERIFARMENLYRGNPAFGSLKSKLAAAEFLARQMESQLEKATGSRMLSIADDIFGNDEKQRKDDKSLIVAPAKKFYEASRRLFSKAISTEEFTNEEKDFLVGYYDLKLRSYTSSIARTGQALAISESDFKGTHDYVLVLPLLHITGEQPVNVNILPSWMRKAGQLRVFSDSCLLHYGMPLQAMELAAAARAKDESFSELKFYKEAAKKCEGTYNNVAVTCLNLAKTHIPEIEHDQIIELKFNIVQLWLDSSSYSLAASQAKDIFEKYPESPETARAIWTYYYALSRSNDVDTILKGIDEAISDRRCEPYKPKLMYIKWWSLRRKRDQGAMLAALEYELVRQFGDNPMVAPILLSQATDLLAQQDYRGASQILNQIANKFPSTKAGIQAKTMLDKLSKVTP